MFHIISTSETYSSCALLCKKEFLARDGSNVLKRMCGAVETRVAKQRFREVKLHIQDYVILLIAGGCLGVLSNMDDTNLGSEGYHFTIIALGTRA